MHFQRGFKSLPEGSITHFLAFQSGKNPQKQRSSTGGFGCQVVVNLIPMPPYVPDLSHQSLFGRTLMAE